MSDERLQAGASVRPDEGLQQRIAELEASNSDLLHRFAALGAEWARKYQDARERAEAAEAEIARLRVALDGVMALQREAVEEVERVMRQRTAFDGTPPYVGWKGLGRALREALDERDALRAAKDPHALPRGATRH